MLIREELKQSRSVLIALPALLVYTCLAGNVFAFQGEIGARGGGEREVIVKREAIQVIDQREYKAALHLDPIRKVDLVAPADGTVLTLLVRPGQKVKPQTEAARMDDSRAALLLKRARAELQAMTLEEKIAQSKGDANLAAAAAARVEAAKADVELAEQGIDRLVVRAPFSGEVVSVHVADGQFVRAGDKLATVIDPSQLQVEVPVERSTVSVGGALDIKVEDVSVKGKVEAVLPLSLRFDPLRELAASPCSAWVTVDNSAGKLSAGQSVFPQLIPQAPVAVVSSAAVANLPDGNRKVQVLRDNVVRDVPVGILAKVGIDRVYVSGWFGSGDEVIVGASRELADGTPLRALAAGRTEPSADVPAAGVNAGAAAGAPAAGGAKKPAATGF